jgi:hypothetical protein
MERITVEKTVSDSGRIEIFIDGLPTNDATSRALTGTTYEENKGIFTLDEDGDNFTFGDFKQYISLPMLDFTWTAEKITDRIAERIKLVREWVKSCKETTGIYHIIFDTDGTYITMKG